MQKFYEVLQVCAWCMLVFFTKVSTEKRSRVCVWSKGKGGIARAGDCCSWILSIWVMEPQKGQFSWWPWHPCQAWPKPPLVSLPFFCGCSQSVNNIYGPWVFVIWVGAWQRKGPLNKDRLKQWFENACSSQLFICWFASRDTFRPFGVVKWLGLPESIYENADWKMQLLCTDDDDDDEDDDDDDIV